MQGTDVSEIALKAGLILRQIELLTARLESEPESLDEIRGQVAQLDEKWDLLMNDLLGAHSESDRLSRWRAKLNRSRSRCGREKGSSLSAQGRFSCF